VSIRGQLSTFNLLDDRCRSQWAARLAALGCDYFITDCLRPILDALGLDENRDAGRFLVHFDAMLAEACVDDAALVHHMGHQNERSRGDSRLQDWPDAIWRVLRDNSEDPTSARFFSAFGRDVNVTEGRLSYNPVNRHLTYIAGSRSDAKTERAKLAIIKLLASSQPLSKNAIEAEIGKECGQKAVRAGLDDAFRAGLVAKETGPSNAQLHRIAYPCSECGLPVVSRQERHLSCPASVEGLDL
jgi:hypothetical protein